VPDKLVVKGGESVYSANKKPTCGFLFVGTRNCIVNVLNQKNHRLQNPKDLSASVLWINAKYPEGIGKKETETKSSVLSILNLLWITS
jgi:hypothetical protein